MEKQTQKFKSNTNCPRPPRMILHCPAAQQWKDAGSSMQPPPPLQRFIYLKFPTRFLSFWQKHRCVLLLLNNLRKQIKLSEVVVLLHYINTK